jgi:hypothetical protein
MDKNLYLVLNMAITATILVLILILYKKEQIITTLLISLMIVISYMWFTPNTRQVILTLITTSFATLAAYILTRYNVVKFYKTDCIPIWVPFAFFAAFMSTIPLCRM